MSKATYHVQQPGEEIEFEDPSGFRYAITVAKWDSKHGIITTDDNRRVYVQNRLSIKLVEPAKEESRVEAVNELRWVDPGETIAIDAPDERISLAPFTAALPTSFASEVERAQAIADAEAEKKKRSEASSAEFKRLDAEIKRIRSEISELVRRDNDADEDFQHRVDYLRSLRVRGE